MNKKPITTKIKAHEYIVIPGDGSGNVNLYLLWHPDLSELNSKFANLFEQYRVKSYKVELTAYDPNGITNLVSAALVQCGLTDDDPASAAVTHSAGFTEASITDFPGFKMVPLTRGKTFNVPVNGPWRSNDGDFLDETQPDTLVLRAWSDKVVSASAAIWNCLITATIEVKQKVISI